MFVSERIAALTTSLLRSDGRPENLTEDDFEMDDIPLVSAVDIRPS